MTWPLLRGHVVRIEIGLAEPKLFLVISNNRRNAAFPQVLGARLTTTPPRAPRPSVVALVHPEVFSGHVVCDDIIEIYENEVLALVGGLTPQAMRAVNRGLIAALGITG